VRRATREIILVRHGETEANRAGRLLGRSDPPLTDTGERQAQAVADALVSCRAAVVLTSPLRRASTTADRIAEVLGVPAQVDERLVELDYGEWEGLGFAELPDGVARRWRDDPGLTPPGGESLRAVRARVGGLCDELLAQEGGGTVIAVSHVSPIKAAVSWALDVGDECSWRMRLDVASVTRIAASPAGPVLLGFNDSTHLA